MKKINDLLRQRVRRRADSLCEYCHSPERISSTRFTIEHRLPRSLGGNDDFDNLALACSRWNQRRYNSTHYVCILSDFESF
jgi:5-methylcytosine-specific restriction endonuclease McrA